MDKSTRLAKHRPGTEKELLQSYSQRERNGTYKDKRSKETHWMREERREEDMGLNHTGNDTASLPEYT